MKEVRYHPLARTELIESAFWYDERQSGLGHRFITAVEDTEKLLRENPQLGMPVESETRMKLVKRFPFAVV